jgi:hypothetical protein
MFAAMARAAAQPVEDRSTLETDDFDDMHDVFDTEDAPSGAVPRRRPRVADVIAGETNLTGIDPALCDCTNEELARALATAPALPAVIATAYRTAGLADDPVPSWRTRSRWSALVPTLSSRIGNSQSWRDVTDPTVNRALSYDVRASWRLERLVFDPNEPRFNAFDLARRRERRRIRAAVTHFYWSWLGARAALASAELEQRRRPVAALQAQRSQSELDALTDGWFTDAADPVRP